MPPLHELIPYVNLLLILFLFYQLWKHHYIGNKKDKGKKKP